MKSNMVLSAAVTAVLALTTCAAVAQDRDRQDNNRNRQVHDRFDDHDQQVTRDWYNKNQSRHPAGFRDQDRLSPEQEGRIREGERLDNNLRRNVHPVPSDLGRQLPPPPPRHRYAAIGGHVVLMDNNYQVKSVIHVHDNH
jgi:Ni/Co efflux regulator RcnB